MFLKHQYKGVIKPGMRLSFGIASCAVEALHNRTEYGGRLRPWKEAQDAPPFIILGFTPVYQILTVPNLKLSDNICKSQEKLHRYLQKAIAPLASCLPPQSQKWGCLWKLDVTKWVNNCWKSVTAPWFLFSWPISDQPHWFPQHFFHHCLFWICINLRRCNFI